jgi:cell wall assembly regulator SMI1
MPQPWEIIRRWLEQHCPAEAARLRPPASEAQLRALEDDLGAPLPADLRGWWRTANGVTEGSWLLPPGFGPYGVEAALGSRRAWLEASEGAWPPLWLPIAGDGGGDDLFVDLRAGPEFGGVGMFRHDEWEYRGPRWPSVTAMFTEIAEVLTSGHPLGGWKPRVADDGLFSWEPVLTGRRTGIRVAEATPEEVGIRPAVAGGLPAYVPRDIDSRLRELIAEPGVFVLVAGPPLAGKTRTLYEAVAAVHPDRELIPVRNDQKLASVARAGYRRQVIWMDDMRADRFGIFLVDSLQRLRRSDAVVVGTCLPSQWASLASPSLAQLTTVLELPAAPERTSPSTG